MSNKQKKAIIRAALNAVGQNNIEDFLVEHLASTPQCYEILEAMCAGLPTLTIEKAQRYMDSCSNVGNNLVNCKVTDVFYDHSPLCITRCVCIIYHEADDTDIQNIRYAEISFFQQ